MRYYQLKIPASLLITMVVFSCGKSDPPEIIEEEELKSGEGPLADGCPNAVYEDWSTSDYVLPFPVGKSYTTNLSHCSGSYHSEGNPDEYAIDFEMPIGSSVTAARAGRVVFMEESGEDGDFPNNLVIIKHQDGTYAQYMHLTEKGATVSVGDEVQQGAEIGLSGNTGLAGYPHLHFITTKAGGFQYPYESFPVTFKNTLSNERSLKSWTTYEAFAY
jgi:hypothetical protein